MKTKQLTMCATLGLITAFCMAGKPPPPGPSVDDPTLAGQIQGSITSAGVYGLEGWDVYIPGRSFFVRTGPDGTFTLNYVPAGTYTLIISRDGVKTRELSGTDAAVVVARKITTLGAVAALVDADGDGFYSYQDCNDNDPTVHPGATEICDGKDNDCNGLVDDGISATWYRDQDGDGYGAPAVSLISCTQPAGYVAVAGDCNDSDAAINPGAAEVPGDGKDNDCDGVIDEGQQYQPDGSAIPIPIFCHNGSATGLRVLFSQECINGTCESTIWHEVNDDVCIPTGYSGLNPSTDAFLQKDYVPAGPITLRLMSRGTTPFGNAFGWYNVTANAPTPSDIHVLFNCDATAGNTVTVNLATDPAYTGGAIGFAMITPQDHTSPPNCASGDCCASISRVLSGEGYCFYTDSQANPDAAIGWIHCLAYKSTLLANRFYLAWEDQPSQDQSFIDMVIVVDGVALAP